MTETARSDFYHKALLRLLKVLFALAKIVPCGEPVMRLPQSVRAEIFRVLLPLESATRRLISFLEQRLEKTPADDASEASAGERKSNDSKLNRKTDKTRAKRPPVFALFDRQKHFSELSDPHKRFVRGPGPRISFFDDRDAPRDPVVEKTPRDSDNALKLCRRLQAVMRALQDMDAQARRLRRILDKRRGDPSTKPKHKSPMRQGRAPGSRLQANWTHEVDEFLYECDRLAHLKPPIDTS